MIALIGAGPLGLEIAVALQHARLPYIHFEAAQIGATMQWWPPATRWFSSNDRIAIAGVPLLTPAQEKATREEYLAYLRGIVEQFDLPVKTYTRVTAIQKLVGPAPANPENKTRFVVSYQPADDETGEHRETVEVEKVILATGGTDVPNLLQIPGEDLPHVSHYFHDPHTYFRQRLLIVGGRNSAVETALRRHRAGAHVHFSYRGRGVDARDIKYWLYPEFSSLLKAGKIVGHFSTCIESIAPGEAVLISSDPDIPAAESRQKVPIDFVLLMTGYRADMTLMKLAGIALQGEQEMPTFHPQTMESNVPGIYVAGTAVAGTQRRYRVFLENCHIHVQRIVAHLSGHAPPPEETARRAEILDRPES